MSYWRRRLSERSTWIGLGAAGAAALTQVGQYLTSYETRVIAVFVAICGVAAALAPTGGKDAES